MAALHHDEVTRRLRAEVAQTDPVSVGAAFAASLTSAPLRYRSTLRAWASASLLPEHEYVDTNDCGVCGVGLTLEDRAAELIQRKETGASIGHPNMLASLVDLEHFRSLPPVAPTKEDLAKLREIITTAANLRKGSRATDLVKALRGVIGRNYFEREAIVETLADCGVLPVRDHPSPAIRWVSFWEQQEMPNIQTDMASPLAWWSADDGVDTAAATRFFPDLDIPRGSELLQARTINSEPVRLPGIRGVRSALELEPGDLLAIATGGRIFAGLILGSARLGKKRLPVLEFAAVAYDDVPEPEAVLSAPSRRVGPYCTGSRWRREPLAIDGLPLIGKVLDGTVLRLARGCTRPAPERLPVVPGGYRVVRDPNIAYLFKMLATESILRAREQSTPRSV